MGGRRKAGAVLYRSTGGRRNKTLARGDCLVFVPSGAAPGLEEASEAIELNGISICFHNIISYDPVGYILILIFLIHGRSAQITA